MNTLIKTIAVLSVGLFSTVLQAIPIAQYNITDPVGNCNTGPHGLWTNQLINDPGHADCKNYFSFESGSLLTEFDDGTATVTATARNPFDVLATITLSYSNYSTIYGNIKNGGNATAAEIADWHFYADVSGTVVVDGNTFNAQNLTNNTALQIGIGANDKTHIFGASSWIDFDQGQNGGNHWDLNMGLAATVPAPTVLMMLVLGLIGVSARSFYRKG